MKMATKSGLLISEFLWIRRTRDNI